MSPSGAGEAVGDFGWLDSVPVSSVEENCLSWSITMSRGATSSSRMTEGWVPDSCCNSIRFICEA